MREGFEYFDLAQDRGGDAPVAGVVQSYLFEGHVGRGIVVVVTVVVAIGIISSSGSSGIDGTSAIDLAVGALADLIEADVVGDGAGGERPSVEGVVGIVAQGVP